MVTTGTILADRYELTDVLGSGGMGVVYLATDRKLGRQVAIKVLRSTATGQSLERFRREARTAATIDHPNICRVFDFHDESETSFIVMEQLQGVTLAEAIRQHGPLAPEEAARVGAEVAEALHAAHALGTVHRDIKPANIFLLEAGGVKVTDFGIALAQGPTVTVSGDVFGTPHYLSPEQVEGARATPRSDLYALGCVLYEAITGQPPFDAEGPLAIGRAHLYEPPPNIQDVGGGIPKELEAIVHRALNKDPADRFHDASEMAGALRAASGSTSGASDFAPTITTTALSRDTQVMPSTPRPEATQPSPALGHPISTSGIKRRLDSAIGKLRLRHVLAVLGLAAAIAVLLLLANSSRSPEQEAPAKAPPPANVVVPDWSGQELAVAQGEAEDLGLLIGEASETLSAQARGTVLSHDPRASAEVAPGTTINFVVSDGEGVEVPNVIGLTVNEAEDLLESHGLESEVDAKGGSKGRRRVEDQDPAPGTAVKRGTKVTLHISEGRDEDDD